MSSKAADVLLQYAREQWVKGERNNYLADLLGKKICGNCGLWGRYSSHPFTSTATHGACEVVYRRLTGRFYSEGGYPDECDRHEGQEACEGWEMTETREVPG